MFRNRFSRSTLAASLLLGLGGAAQAAYALENPIPSSSYLSKMLVELDKRAESGTLAELLPKGCYQQMHRERDFGVEYAQWAAKAANRDNWDITQAHEGVNQAYYEELLAVAMLSATPVKAFQISMAKASEKCQAQLAVDPKLWRESMYEAAKQFPAPRAGDPATDFSLLYTAALANTVQSLVTKSSYKAQGVLPVLELPPKGAARYVFSKMTPFSGPLPAKKPVSGFPKKGQPLTAAGWTSLKLPASCVKSLQSLQKAGDAVVEESFNLRGATPGTVKDGKKLVAITVSDMALSLGGWASDNRANKAAIAELDKDCIALQKPLAGAQDAAVERARIEFNELTGWARKRQLDIEGHGNKALRLLRTQF